MGHSGRFELKYVLGEARALAVADFLRGYLRPSEHNGSGPIAGHPVITLYLDSPDLLFFHQAFTGHKNRMKLRIRFYDGEWQHPAFLEIKRRVGDVICKDRAMMSRDGVRQMLCVGWPHGPFWPDHTLLSHGRRRQDVNADFWGFANTIRASGLIYVSYWREIFEAPDDEELRVTLDRQIRGSLYDGSGVLKVPKRGWRPRLPFFPPDGVVLELKFNDRAPGWMFEMVKALNLDRRSVCKYSACIDAMGLQWRRRVLPEQEEDLAI